MGPGRRFSTRANRFVLRVLAPSPWLTERLRIRILRWGGVAIGENVRIEHGSDFVNSRITVGDRCYINTHCVLDPGGASISLGDDVHIGTGSVLSAATHGLGGSSCRALGTAALPVVVEDGCWLGARVVVLPGVTVAKGSVIGAGAVVTGSTDPNSVYAGVPARVVRALEPDTPSPDTDTPGVLGIEAQDAGGRV